VPLPATVFSLLFAQDRACRFAAEVNRLAFQENTMGTILIVLLVLLLLGALPTWPYSGSWGYYPSGGLGLVLLIVVILALTGRV
ncbi:MAG TPA: DUF3309 domain-containing protein, partial [Terriglobales bacterium]|nr:DUF3309 domain-containing protein [Terriglobales bacterium]